MMLTTFICVRFFLPSWIIDYCQWSKVVEGKILFPLVWHHFSAYSTSKRPWWISDSFAFIARCLGKEEVCWKHSHLLLWWSPWFNEYLFSLERKFHQLVFNVSTFCQSLAVVWITANCKQLEMFKDIIWKKLKDNWCHWHMILEKCESLEITRIWDLGRTA